MFSNSFRREIKHWEWWMVGGMLFVVGGMVGWFISDIVGSSYTENERYSDMQHMIQVQRDALERCDVKVVHNDD